MKLNENINSKLISSSDTELVYELDITSIDKNIFALCNNSSENIKVNQIRIEKLDNSVTLPVEDNITLTLNPGSYIFVCTGSDVKGTEMTFESENSLSVFRTNNGKEKVAYEVKVDQTCNLTVSLSFKDSVDSFYYQNAILNSFEIENLNFYDRNNGIFENEDGTLYGPYVKLEEGVYTINIYGENLKKANIWFQKDNGTLYDSISLIKNNNQNLTYLIDTNTEIENLEILIQCTKESGSQVFYYTIEKMNSNFSKDIELNYSYNDTDIQTTGYVDNVNQQIILLNGEKCYGPYINLPEGNYKLLLNGSSLDAGNVSITCNNGQKLISNLNVESIGNDLYQCNFELESFTYNIEIVIENTTDYDIILKDYTIYSLSDSI